MKIRTVFQPDVELEVPDDEADALRLQGLLHVPQPALEPRPTLEQATSDSAPPDASPKPMPKQQPAASVPEPTSATEKG